MASSHSRKAAYPMRQARTRARKAGIAGRPARFEGHFPLSSEAVLIIMLSCHYVCDTSLSRWKGNCRVTPNMPVPDAPSARSTPSGRSEEHTSELQSLLRIPYAAFCLKPKIHTTGAEIDSKTRRLQ